MKILMVCLGNICRSPLAEGILQSKLNENHQVDSAGTSHYHDGEPPDSRSIKVAKNHGIDISEQRSRPFLVEDFDHFDYIFGMDNQNVKDLYAMARNDEDIAKIHLLYSSCYGKENIEIPDPYYGGEKEFENVYQLIDQATDCIVEKLVK